MNSIPENNFGRTDGEGSGGQFQSRVQNVCLFCYKSYSEERDSSNDAHSDSQFRGGESGDNDNDKSCKITGGLDKSLQLFFTLLERHLQKGARNVASPGQYLPLLSSISDTSRYSLDCCKDCKAITNSFSQTYHQVKCLKLELEWKLEKLTNIMRRANRVPSRVLQFKSLFLDAQQSHANSVYRNSGENQKESGHFQKRSLKRFKRFRHRIMKKCAKQLSRSKPRVVLAKLEAGKVVTTLTTPAPRIMNLLRERIETTEQNNLNSAQPTQRTSNVGVSSEFPTNYVAAANNIESVDDSLSTDNSRCETVTVESEQAELTNVYQNAADESKTFLVKEYSIDLKMELPSAAACTEEAYQSFTQTNRFEEQQNSPNDLAEPVSNESLETDGGGTETLNNSSGCHSDAETSSQPDSFNSDNDDDSSSQQTFTKDGEREKLYWMHCTRLERAAGKRETFVKKSSCEPPKLVIQGCANKWGKPLRLYVCGVCGRNYGRNRNKFRHCMEKHKKGPMECDVCGKVLRMHRHKCSGHPPIPKTTPVCCFCHREFSRVANLNKHTKTVHKIK